MYGWIWRRIPGRLPAKLAASFGLVLVALVLLVFVVFPWIEPRLPWNDVTVNSPSVVQTPEPSIAPSFPPEEVPSDLPAE